MRVPIILLNGKFNKSQVFLLRVSLMGTMAKIVNIELINSRQIGFMAFEILAINVRYGGTGRNMKSKTLRFYFLSGQQISATCLL